MLPRSGSMMKLFTVLKRSGVDIITAYDGKNRSNGSLETSLLNAIAACQ